MSKMNNLFFGFQVNISKEYFPYLFCFTKTFPIPKYGKGNLAAANVLLISMKIFNDSVNSFKKKKKIICVYSPYLFHICLK